jgi:hypothetical protein
MMCSVPLRRRDDGACSTIGRRRSSDGTGVYWRRSSPGGTTCASGTQRSASKEPTICASAPRAYASCSGALPRMSEPRKCKTDFLRAALSRGHCIRRGTSVQPK